MDIELFYTKAGSGPPLLLLHGNGEDGTYFVHQIEEFSRDFTVYAIDTRGHGKSPRGAAPFTISQFADDLLAFMDQQGLAQADILGFSDGGNIALTFALRHPDRVRRLILNGANLDPKGVKPLVQLPIVAGYHLASLFKSPKAKEQPVYTQEYHGNQSSRKALKKSVGSLISTIGLVAYFVISFATGAWFITWLIFPIAGAVQGLVRAILDLKEAVNNEA